MRRPAVLFALLLATTQASADSVDEPLPDTLSIELSPADSASNTFQVTITNHNNQHFYLRDPAESVADVQHDTFRFHSEPVPGAARFNGLIRGSGYRITPRTVANDEGDWQRLRLWKSVALSGVHVPANGGKLSFEVSPSDHVSFSAAGTYRMSVGLTLVALSADRSEIFQHHVATNPINMTVATPTEEVDRRALAGTDGQACSKRQEQLIQHWLQQALFSVKDAQGEALGGKFHKLYKDDINSCFGTGLGDKHQVHIRDGLKTLEQLLDPKKGGGKVTVKCDNSDSDPKCKPDEFGDVPDSFFSTSGANTQVTLCSRFFYSASHCAYQYKSASNNLAAVVVQATPSIATAVVRERMVKLMPEIDPVYKSSQVIEKTLSADERVRFFASWQCFLSRRSKDPVITADACNAKEQSTAREIQTGIFSDDLLSSIDELVGDTAARRSRSQRREQGKEQRRRLVPMAGKFMTADKDLKIDANTVTVIQPMDERKFDIIHKTVDAPTSKWVKWRSANQAKKFVALDGADQELNMLSAGQKVVQSEKKCKKMGTDLRTDLAKQSVERIAAPVKAILKEALGTGVYDLQSPGRQEGNPAQPLGNLKSFATALGQFDDGLLKLKASYYILINVCKSPKAQKAAGIEGGTTSGDQISQLEIGKAIDAAKAFRLKDPTQLWTAAEPRGMAMARATVVVLLGAFFHDYSVDYDLGGDVFINHAMHRLDQASAQHRDDALKLIIRSYGTVLRMVTTMTAGHPQSDVEFEELGLHKHFSPNARGRQLLDALVNEIQDVLDGTKKMEAQHANFNVPALSAADEADEFKLLTILSRTPRREVRELRATKWQEYKDGLRLLQNSGVYADFIYTHNRYFYGTRIHDNPRFLPWHRAFLLTFDEEISKVLKKPVRAPFWDWSAEPTDDSKRGDSAIFKNHYFGVDGTGGGTEVVKPAENGYPGTAFKLVGGETVQFGKCVPPGVDSTGLPHPFPKVRNWHKEDGYTGQANLDRCLSRGENVYHGTMPVKHEGPPGDRSIHGLLGISPDAKGPRSFAHKIEVDFHNNVHSAVSGDMVKPGSPADPLFWSHHAMLDYFWAAYQAQSPEHAARYGYNLGDKQKGEKDWFVYKDGDGKEDSLNQGFEDSRAGTNKWDKENAIKVDTKREFKVSDWMVFLEPKFRAQPTLSLPRPTRWTVAELMEERHYYQTFQYNRDKYRKVLQPSEEGLTTSPP